MSVPLAILAAAFLLVPLPLCIYLIVQHNKYAKRILDLEIQQNSLKRQLARPQTDRTSAPSAAPHTNIHTQVETPSAPQTQATPVPAAKPIPPQPKSQTPPISIQFDDDLPAPAFATSSPTNSKPQEKEAATAPLKSTLNPIQLLRSIGLWPPEELARREAGLIQWWAPRLGGLLAVLTVIFASVYISHGSPPWVRFTGLSFFDLLVTGTGIFFLNRHRRFGVVLLATGLSMLYLTSIAGYAAPPVRIISNPLIGVLLQLAIVAIIFLTSRKINERGLALVALIFGFSSAIFSALEGLTEAALLSSLVLYAASIPFYRSFKWKPLITVSAVGVYLPVLTLCALKALKPNHVIAPDAINVLIFLGLSLSLLPAICLKTNVFAIQGRLHGLNTTLALFCGYTYFKLFNLELPFFYGWASLVFIAWAVAFTRRGLSDYRFQLFFIKASALAALWVVNTFAGDIRWFALVLEAVVISAIAIRSRSLWKEALCFVLWIVSLAIALDTYLIKEVDPWTLPWYLLLCLPLLAAAFQGLLYKAYPKNSIRTGVYTLAAIINGLTATFFVVHTQTNDDTLPLYMGGYVLVFAALSALPFLSRISIAIPSALILAIANVVFWDSPDLITSALAVIAISAAAALAGSLHLSTTNQKRYKLPEFIFHSLWVISLYAFIQNHFQEQAWITLLAPIMAIAILFASRRPLRTLADVSLIPIFLQILNFEQQEASRTIALISILAYLAFLVLPNYKPQLIPRFGLLRFKKSWRPITHILVLLVLIQTIKTNFEWQGQTILFSLLSIAFYALWHLHRRKVAFICSAVSIAFSFGLIYMVWTPYSERITENLPWTSEFLIATGLAILVTLGLAIALLKQTHRSVGLSERTKISYIIAGLSYIICALCFSYGLINLQGYYTPIVAAYSLILIVIGLALSLKPLRLIGLIGLLLPIYRLFAYDIKETLYRIIAFAALAALLGLIGYLYTRFQSRIEDSK